MGLSAKLVSTIQTEAFQLGLLSLVYILFNTKKKTPIAFEDQGHCDIDF